MARIVDVKAFLENFPFESTANPSILSLKILSLSGIMVFLA